VKCNYVATPRCDDQAQRQHHHYFPKLFEIDIILNNVVRSEMPIPELQIIFPSAEHFRTFPYHDRKFRRVFYFLYNWLSE